MVRSHAWSYVLCCMVSAAIAEQRMQPWRVKIQSALRKSRIIDGCSYMGYQYTPSTAMPIQEDNHTMCQRLCQATENCAYFTFMPMSRSCQLANADAVFAEHEGAIAGPRDCQHNGLSPSCTELPTVGPFPGATPEESALAFPSHRVPGKLECWPKNWTGGWYDSCPTMSVLEDTENGFPGKCLGLQQVVVPYGETCESFCTKKISCAVWQLVNTSDGGCFHGVGNDCYKRGGETSFVPTSAARVMHGTVRVLANLTGVQILGLKNAFDETFFVNVTPDATTACRYNCLSNVKCAFWQYSTTSGCWTEQPNLATGEGFVQMPPTTANWLTGTKVAKSTIAGEWIQHICPEGPQQPGHQATPGVASGSSQDGSGLGPDRGVVSMTSGGPSTVDIQMTVSGMAYGQLTTASRHSLASMYARDIEATLRVPTGSVRDVDGYPDAVTLGPDAAGLAGTGGGTLLRATCAVPEGGDAASVKHALSMPTFAERMGETSRSEFGGAGAVLGPLSVVGVSVGAHVPVPTPVPTVAVAPAGRAWPSDVEEDRAADAEAPTGSSTPPFAWALLAVLVLCLLGAAGVLRHVLSGRGRKKARLASVSRPGSWSDSEDSVVDERELEWPVLYKEGGRNDDVRMPPPPPMLP